MPNLLYVPKNVPHYLMLKNGEASDIKDCKELIDIMLHMKNKDEVLIRSNLEENFAAVCIKFQGAKECLASAFFGDICKKRDANFQYIPFGYDRNQPVNSPTYYKSSLFNFTYFPNVREFDEKFNRLWNDTMKTTTPAVEKMFEVLYK